MKKVFSLLAVLALLAMVSSSVFAAVSITKESVADFSSSGEVSLSFTLKYVDNDSEASTIDWPIANIPLNQAATAWTTSTVYAELTATVTKNNGAIYMYQNNTAEGTYQATAHRTDGSKKIYSGLVNTATHGGETRGFVPLAYLISTTKIADPSSSFGTNPGTVPEGARYFNDRADDEFTSTATTNYITIANIGGLVKGTNNDGCYNFTNHETTGFMYFGGWFDNIYGGETWGTDKIKIVSTIE